MSSRRQALLLVGLLLAAVVTRVLFSRALRSPGIVDAVYYYDAARSLAEGHGLTSRVVWCFLAPPKTIVHPAHGYWGPLLSFYLAAVFALFGAHWAVAAAAMTVLSLFLFALTFLLGLRLFRSFEIGLLGAAFLILNVPLTYLSVTTETPVPFAVLVNACLLLLVGAREGKERWWYASAFLAGLAALVRNEGLLLCGLVVIFAGVHGHRTRNGRARFILPLLMALTCLLVLTPWKLRNHAAFGDGSPVSLSRQLTMTSYDELFRLDGPEGGGFFGVPLGELFLSKLHGLKENLKNLFTKEILLLFVFCIPALPTTLRDPRLLPFWAYGASIVVALGAIFPFHSSHGTFFRSMIALYPFLACVSVYGFGRVIDVIHRKIRRQAWRSLVKTAREAGMHALLLVFAAVWVASLQHPNIQGFHQLEASCLSLKDWLGKNVDAKAPLLTNLSLDVAHHTGHPCVQIPRDGREDALLDVAKRYGIRHVVILNSPRFIMRQWGAEIVPIADARLKRIARLPASAPGLGLHEILVYRIGGQ